MKIKLALAGPDGAKEEAKTLRMESRVLSIFIFPLFTDVGGNRVHSPGIAYHSVGVWGMDSPRKQGFAYHPDDQWHWRPTWTESIRLDRICNFPKVLTAMLFAA